MTDYIKREEAEKIFVEYSCVKHHVTEMGDTNEANRIMLMFRENAKKLFSLAPSVDVAPVVRCEECKKWESLGNGTGICRRSFNALYWIGTDATDFCSFAERKSTMDEEN